jgi:cadmium resistance protein CadD (predicted permease)
MNKVTITLTKNMSKARIGILMLILGILIFLFGIKYTETCIITTIIGLIMFFIGMWMVFMKSEKGRMKL